MPLYKVGANYENSIPGSFWKKVVWDFWSKSEAQLENERLFKEEEKRKAEKEERSRAAADSAMWNELKYSTDIADLQRYLEKFPNGVFVSLAEQQMRNLVQKGDHLKQLKEDKEAQGGIGTPIGGGYPAPLSE